MKKLLAIILAVCVLPMGAAALAEATEAAADETSAAETGIVLPDLTGAGVQPEAEDGGGAPADEPGAGEDDALPEEGEADAEAAALPQAEPGEPFALWFEEGFALTLPEGWVSYPVSADDRRAGTRYALGDGDGRYLFIQAQPTLLEDNEALTELIEITEGLEKTGDLTFGGTPFVTFVGDGQDVSGCAMLWGGEIVSFLFTPKSDSDYMLTVTELMDTFTTL